MNNWQIINFIYDKVQDYLGEIKFVLLPEDDFLLTYEIEKEENIDLEILYNFFTLSQKIIHFFAYL